MSDRTELSGSNEKMLPDGPAGLSSTLFAAAFLVTGGFISGFILFRLNLLSEKILFVFRMAVLGTASVRDYRFRRLGHIYEILILVSGCFGFESVSDLTVKTVSAILAFGFLAALYGRRKKHFMGGADIRMLTVLFLALGPQKMFICCFAVCFLLLLTLGVSAVLKKSGKKSAEKVPLLPYITAGVLVSYIII